MKAILILVVICVAATTALAVEHKPKVRRNLKPVPIKKKSFGEQRVITVPKGDPRARGVANPYPFPVKPVQPPPEDKIIAEADVVIKAPPALRGTPVAGRRGTTVHLLMGLGGKFTSPGVYTQAAQIKALGPDVSATVWAWDDWDRAAADLIAQKSTKHVAIGYSNGASKVQELANRLFQNNVRLDLLVAEDPTIWLPTTPLRANVMKAICFKNVNPASSFPPVGHASLKAGPDFPLSRLTTIETTLSHTAVDTDPKIIATVVQAVKAVVEAP